MLDYKERVNMRNRYNHYSVMTLKVKEYLDWMLSKAYSEETVKSRWYELRYFIIWTEDRGLNDPREISSEILERYRLHLYHSKTGKGKPFTAVSQYGRLNSISCFFKRLRKSGYLSFNPALELEYPKLGSRLPGSILTRQEVETVMEQVNFDNPMGYRDRAILELFYSSGIRRTELKRLMLDDIDLERGILKVREGKGKKDRIIPIGERACAWLNKYIRELRITLVDNESEDNRFLFLNRKGDPLTSNSISDLVRGYIAAAGINKKGACHMFRHTMATLMLEGGADIRYIQEMLGHARLDTTQIYTKVSIRKLQEVHSRTHPGANLKNNVHASGGQGTAHIPAPRATGPRKSF